MVSVISKVSFHRFLAVAFFVSAGLPAYCQSSLTGKLEMDQCVVVIVENQTSVKGELRFLERTRINSGTYGSWQIKLDKIPVSLGKNGSVWGSGLHPESWISGVKKKEGDKKSPRGVFDIGAVFGYATSDTSLHRVYLHSDSSCYCVDDSSSKYYNQIVSTRHVRKDWNSAEKMLRNDMLYRWGLEIGYNISPRTPGAGSCIFLHPWDSAGTPTAGCTSLAESNLIKIIRMLSFKKVCGYILLTKSEYLAHKSELGIP